MRTSEQCHRLVVLWEGQGSVDFDVDFSYCCFLLHCCRSHGVDAEQGTDVVLLFDS